MKIVSILAVAIIISFHRYPLLPSLSPSILDRCCSSEQRSYPRNHHSRRPERADPSATPDWTGRIQPSAAYVPNHTPFSNRFDPFFADRLAFLCGECNFDGYLVNIEIPAISPSLVRLLIQFLKELRAQLKSISEFHQVIWYDSIDNRGYLNYQNKLTAQNRPYFDAVDGIFLNYWWKPDDLVMTRRAAGSR